MKYKIIKYEENQDCHILVDEHGLRFMVDIMICGDLDLPNNTSYLEYCHNLIGSTVEISDVTPYVYTALDVEILTGLEQVNDQN